jgi:nitroreductase
VNAFDAIVHRQGIFRFRKDPLDRRLIQHILLAAAAAPSPANTQPWEFIVVDNPLTTKKIAEYLVETQAEYIFRQLLATPESFINQLLRFYENLENAPCFIIICRYQRTALTKTDFAAVVRDWDLCALGAAMANLMTAATEMGLGTRWFGNPMMNPEPLKRMLNIPEALEIVAVTPLGYHDEQPKERPRQPIQAHTKFQRGDKYKLAALLEGRLALSDLVHFNEYKG